jgi:hypothetical protein
MSHHRHHVLADLLVPKHKDAADETWTKVRAALYHSGLVAAAANNRSWLLANMQQMAHRATLSMALRAYHWDLLTKVSIWPQLSQWQIVGRAGILGTEAWLKFYLECRYQVVERMP